MVLNPINFLMKRYGIWIRNQQKIKDLYVLLFKLKCWLNFRNLCSNHFHQDFELRYCNDCVK